MVIYYVKKFKKCHCHGSDLKKKLKKNCHSVNFLVIYFMKMFEKTAIAMLIYFMKMFKKTVSGRYFLNSLKNICHTVIFILINFVKKLKNTVIAVVYS